MFLFFTCSLSVILKNLGIQCFTMRDIDRMGMQKVMEVTLDHLLARCTYLYTHTHTLTFLEYKTLVGLSVRSYDAL